MLEIAKEVAEHSVPENSHKVGCAFVCMGNLIFKGATAVRTRAIGSTCAERMALDQWYFSKQKTNPRTCYLVGKLNRNSWRDSFICTPCGSCLEMYLELVVSRKLRNLKLVCANWKLSRVLVANLSDLFPQVGKGGWPYTKHIGVR